MFKNRFIIAGLLIIGLIALGGLVEPFIFPAEAELFAPFSPPSPAHIFGTDDVGHDVLREVLKGGQTSLAVGLIVGLTSAGIGILIGAAAGFFEFADAPLMRLTDFLLVIPRLPLIIFLALFLKPSFWNVVIILSVFGWTTTARAVRPLVKNLRRTEFILAAKVVGGTELHILLRHILPHLYSIFAVQFVLEARMAITAEAGLGFLGIEDPTTKSWGLMLFHAFQHEATFITNVWIWTVLPPAVILMFFILALGLIALGFESVFNPKLRVEKRN